MSLQQHQLWNALEQRDRLTQVTMAHLRSAAAPDSQNTGPRLRCARGTMGQLLWYNSSPHPRLSKVSKMNGR